MALVITRGFPPQLLCIQGSGALCPEVGRMLLTKQFERAPVIGQAKCRPSPSRSMSASAPPPVFTALNIQLQPGTFHGAFSSFSSFRLQNAANRTSFEAADGLILKTTLHTQLTVCLQRISTTVQIKPPPAHQWGFMQYCMRAPELPLCCVCHWVLLKLAAPLEAGSAPKTWKTRDRLWFFLSLLVHTGVCLPWSGNVCTRSMFVHSLYCPVYSRREMRGSRVKRRKQRLISFVPRLHTPGL